MFQLRPSRENLLFTGQRMMNHNWNFLTQHKQKVNTKITYTLCLYIANIFCLLFPGSSFFTASSLHLYVSTHAARSKSMVLGELSRLSRPCSPLDQEKALKAGWLKRQRSIMKNWQLRWFVLRAEALYFYKDQDETKAQVAKHEYILITHILYETDTRWACCPLLFGFGVRPIRNHSVT